MFRSPHRRIDRWIRANPYKVDVALGGAYTLFAVGGSLTLGYPLYNDIYLALLALLQSAPLMFRRRNPWAVTLIVALAHVLQVASHSDFLPSQLSVPILVYTMALYGRRWQSFATLGLGVLGALLVAVRLAMNAGAVNDAGLGFFVSFVGLSLVVLVAWTFGDLARTRRLAVEALHDRARRLELERQYERDLAASDERNHIAREMHDIIAHSLSVIISQADGARYAAAKDPRIAIDTLQTIATAGRTSLREMRRLLGVLRTADSSGNRPLPSLDDVEDLVHSTRRSGLDVELSMTGSPRRPLPAGAELTAYRCVQESLTNVMKHAGANAAAWVGLEWTGAGLQIRVTDNGRGAGALGVEGTGQGLRGMRERVTLYDGQATAGPIAGGGFQVSVFIPYTED